MLKLSTKCWISAFNAQGSRGFIVAVKVGAAKIYVAAVEALRKKARQGETQEQSKFAGLKKISPCVWPNWGHWCCLFLTLLRISLIGMRNYPGKKQAYISVLGCSLLLWRTSGSSLKESMRMVPHTHVYILCRTGNPVLQQNDEFM
jgi:hypothetical protein